jgi:putative phage-type endonuclease
MIEQRSPEWFKQRKGKLTGSNVGAALGLNPWKTPEALIRQMVREYHGAESEFTGSVATEYGTLHEPLAQMDYQTKTGNFVEECGFFVHPEYDWLGASPDGLIGQDGVLEIKCPFGLRNKKGAELIFKTAEEQPHYHAQMQIELACTQRNYCHFYQWAKSGDSIETVDYDPQWFEDNLPKLRAFYDWYLSELDNPAHLEPLVKEVNTLGAKSLLDEYDRLTATIDDATARKKEVLSELITMAKDRSAIIHGRKLTQVERAGSVSYAKAIKELAPDADLTKWTGKPTRYWKLS